MLNKNKFNGYKPEIKTFLTELAANNSKEWFDENRIFYEKEIRDTSKNLISDLSLMFAMKELPYIADTKKSMFRMNRDIRFSSNKDPYKTNIGMFFPFSLIQASKKSTNSIGLYFHIDAKQVFIAGGVPYPDNNTLALIREKLAQDWEELLEIENDFNLKNVFDSEINLVAPLKKIPRGYEANHPAAELLKRKDFGYLANLQYNQIFNRELLQIIIEKAELLSHYLEFFRDAVER